MYFTDDTGDLQEKNKEKCFKFRNHNLGRAPLTLFGDGLWLMIGL
jgi:hypothetical protein